MSQSQKSPGPRDMGVQVPCRVHAKVPQEAAVWANQAAPGHCISRACPAQGMQDRRRAPDARPRPYADIDPSEIFGCGGDRISEREKLDLDCAERGTQAAQFSGPQILGEGDFVSTYERDEETIRTYIKNQEMADKQLDQLQLKLASS